MNITSEQLNQYLLNLTIPYEQNNAEIFKRSSCKRYNLSFEYFQNLTKLSKNRIVDKFLLLCGWTAQSPATWYLCICSYVGPVFFLRRFEGPKRSVKVLQRSPKKCFQQLA
ncbi:unnamed protein product [Clavelina lepadiformis]|uniref:Uncharacterized protein n=1 Tax=Clavelina lepadiformis TaxID=159417 RepID=A0ABP0FZ04_CLALP